MDMTVAKISEEDGKAIAKEQYLPNRFFNPTIDKDGNTVVSIQELEHLLIRNINHSIIEYKPKIEQELT